MKSCKKLTATVLALMLVLSSFIVMPANAISTNDADTNYQYSVATSDEAINIGSGKNGLYASKGVSTSGSNYLFMYYFQHSSTEQIVFTQNTTTNNTAFKNKKAYTYYTYGAGVPIELFLIGSKKISGTSSYSTALKNGYLPAFCVYPGRRIDYAYNAGYKLKNFNNYYNSLKPAVQTALKTLSAASSPGRYNIDRGTTNEKEIAYATQLLYWEFITGHRSVSNRTTKYYASTNCNFSKRIKNVGTKASIKVSDIQSYYNAIVAEMKRLIKSENPKGKRYDPRDGDDYGERMGTAKSYVTTMAKADKEAKKSAIRGEQRKGTLTTYKDYKYIHYATIENYYNSNGSTNFKDYAIVNQNGTKANGSGKKFVIGTVEKVNNVNAKFTIYSKKSFQEYEESLGSKYYFKFVQKAPTISGVFGANKTADNSWQNVAVRFPYSPKKFYARITSAKPPIVKEGSIIINKTCRQGTAEQFKTMPDAEEGWCFKVEGKNYNGVVVTDEDGTKEILHLPLNETYKVTELGRLYTGDNPDEDLEADPAPVTIGSKTYGFPKGWSPSETNRRTNLIISKTITENNLEQAFNYYNYFGKQEFRIQKESDDDKVEGFYFQVYDADYENNSSTTKHIDRTIVGPTDEEGLTAVYEVPKIGTFNLGVKELGLYKGEGDKNNIESYAIPDQYDKPTEDVVEEISPATSDEDSEEEISVITVHNSCSGYIQVNKTGVVKCKDITKPVGGAVYGIYKEKIFAASSDEIAQEDDEDSTDETEATEESYDETEPGDEDIEGSTEDDDADPEPEEETTEATEPDEEGGDENDEPVEYSNRLTTRNGNLVQTLVTGENGLSEMSESLSIGTYYVQEISAPDGTYYSDEIYEVTVVPKTNTEENPNVEIVKVTDALTYVDFYKVDADGNKMMSAEDADIDISKISFVDGAKIELLDEEGNVIKDWTSGKSNVELIGELQVGKTYTFHEASAPDGYTLAEDITFTIPEKAEDVTVDNSKVVMVNTSVDFTKTDLTGGQELEGAEIEVKDEDGNVVDEWKSTTEPHHIKNLVVDKTYTLTEKIAPEGYNLSSETIEFTTKKNCDQHLKMKDSVTDFIKVDNSGAVVEGAEIQILKDGKVIDKFTTTKEPHVVSGLIEGETYTIHETKAPVGYKIANDKEFTVQKGKDTHASMIDVLKDKHQTAGNVLPWILGFAGLACVAGTLLLILLKRKRTN